MTVSVACRFVLQTRPVSLTEIPRGAVSHTRAVALDISRGLALRHLVQLRLAAHGRCVASLSELRGETATCVYNSDIASMRKKSSASHSKPVQANVLLRMSRGERCTISVMMRIADGLLGRPSVIATRGFLVSLRLLGAPR